VTRRFGISSPVDNYNLSGNQEVAFESAFELKSCLIHEKYVYEEIIPSATVPERFTFPFENQYINFFSEV
jgi:hypothetical protein